MDLGRALDGIVPAQRLSTRWIDRIAHANDASVYRLLPAAIVHPHTIEEIQRLLSKARELSIPITFRSAGTSLSGQAVTDGILAVLSRGWRELEALDDGARVRFEPGVLGGAVNARLAPFGRKIGPDPASIQSCMMGGILANNSSGMCCGVEQNAYRTLDTIRFVLPDGLMLDTADPDAAARLEREAPQIADGLRRLRRRILGDDALLEKIRLKVRLKNTMGYTLQSFIDHEHPLDILAHLLIGSEGTLAFIAQAVLHTVPDNPLRYTGLLAFDDVPQACASIVALRDSGARTLELMDRSSLRSIEHDDAIPDWIRRLPDQAAALLIEYQAADVAGLEGMQQACDALLERLPRRSESVFTRDGATQATLWRVRKGIIPTIGAMRRRGSSCIIEDVVFPPERLAQGVAELQQLCRAHGYDDVAIFGHAKDGNLHFVLTQSFDEQREIDRYDRFMRALAQLVAVRHGGSLKAEHGTGRNMAPFLATEWGVSATQIMWEVKRLIDPDRLLNPGVMLNDDPRAHIRHLKRIPRVDETIDACIECGFCERVCPSRDLTLTPRQRIVVRRAMAQLEREGDERAHAALEQAFEYDGIDSCATDGLCSLACPVGIDTGALIKKLRRRRRPALQRELARIAAGQIATVESLTRGALLLHGWLRRAGVDRARLLPAAATALHDGSDTPSALLFVSCVTRVCSPDNSQPSLPERICSAAARFGRPLRVVGSGHCCGLAFSSKGLDEAATVSAEASVRHLHLKSDGGRLPVIVEASPCSQALKHCRPTLGRSVRDQFDRLRILDSVEFADELALGRPPLPSRLGSVVLHPTCSLHRMGLEQAMRRVAHACARNVIVPSSAGCCGFAGDRGFLVPELTAAATRQEAAELADDEHDGYYSSSRTCEFGLARATGRPYRHIWELIDEASTPTDAIPTPVSRPTKVLR